MALGIGQQGAVQHLQAGAAGTLQPPRWILGAWLEGALAGPEQQGQQQTSGDQGTPGLPNTIRLLPGFHGPPCAHWLKGSPWATRNRMH